MNFRDRLSKLQKPLIIGIAGDSGSGKTTYSNGIRRLIGIDLVQTITMHGYHKEGRLQRKISGKLPLEPSANKLDLLLEHLKLIKKGQQVEIPIYNHQSGDFDPPITFSPSPIVIIEGLHALYPEFLPYLDFAIYVDPSRQVKWEFKFKRDILSRGHQHFELKKEMLKREEAYKRWIDFQKTSADVVIKIDHTRINDFARYELINPDLQNEYKVELIMVPAPNRLPDLNINLDLSDLFSINQSPFLIAGVPSLYWGKKVITVVLDGLISEKTCTLLEKHIISLTGIPVAEMFKLMPVKAAHEKLSAVQFAQLLIGWRFLELVNHRLSLK